MNKLDEFIIDAIEKCWSYEILGEEIRSLEMALLDEYFKSKDPIYEFLLALMMKYTENENLGFHLKNCEEKIKIYFSN